MTAAAWTDAVLALAAFSGAWWSVRSRGGVTGAGLVLLGLAATAGTFRLGGIGSLAGVHDALSLTAGVAGLPLAAAGLYDVDAPNRRRRKALIGAGALLILASWALDPSLVRTLRTPITGAAMVAALGLGVLRRSPITAAGPVLVLCAGLGIAGEGAWLGFDRIAWFHLVMAVAALCFGRAPTVLAAR